MTSPRPRDEAARRKLTQAIQTELRRVACYDREIDGDWSEATRRAMKAFTDRINATLPLDEPDYILLTLVQGQQSRACGKDCPPGQAAVGEDRCEPRAIIAQKIERAARVQQEAQIRKTKADAERQARKPVTAPQIPPVAALPRPPATVLDVPLRAPAMAVATDQPPAAPAGVPGVAVTDPAPAAIRVVDAGKVSPQLSERPKPRAARRRNIGTLAPAFGLGRVNRPPTRAVIRQTGSRVRASPFASLTRSAP